MDRFAGPVVVFQSAGIQAGKFHVFRRDSGIQGIQPLQDTLAKSRANLRIARFLLELRLPVCNGLSRCDAIRL